MVRPTLGMSRALRRIGSMPLLGFAPPVRRYGPLIVDTHVPAPTTGAQSRS